MPILEVQHLYKNFGSTKVLKDISFTLERGKALAIIGSSGSGKTTLLRCLNFLETPNEGKIIVNGETLLDAADHTAKSDAQIRKNRLHFGMVFQSFNLVTRTTVIKNVLSACVPDMPFWRVLLGAFRKEDKLKALESLDKVGILDKAYMRADQLSGGQQQRVAIARALANNPRIMLCDEATSALDTRTTVSVLNLLAKINKELGVTLVVITHSLAVARHICDRVAVIDEGVIVEEGPTRQVLESPQSEAARELVSFDSLEVK